MAEESHNDDDRSSASSDDESSQSEPDLMITTREKRKTAANRYNQVLAQEQADEDEQDEVNLLFAEAEGEDDEYNSDEADDEADMSSSGDDDDQGPNAAADDMEGESELQKQAKLDRQKKRKADMAMTTISAIRKKPKLDPTALHRAPEKPKPSKRKERESWLPDETLLPGRTSKRAHTVAHRETMRETLKEKEELRLKNKALREAKEKLKQAQAPKDLTQADRLAEAEKNERRNAKSLNRWETMEKQRAEEQAARLAALKNRTIHGPVITTYSSKHTYRGPKLELLPSGQSGTDDHQPKKRGPKPKTEPIQPTLPRPIQTGPFLQSHFTNIVTINAGHSPSTATDSPGPPAASTSTSALPGPKQTTQSSANPGWLTGIHEYASMQSASGEATPQDARSCTDASEKTEKLQEDSSNDSGPVAPQQNSAGDQSHPSLSIEGAPTVPPVPPGSTVRVPTQQGQLAANQALPTLSAPAARPAPLTQTDSEVTAHGANPPRPTVFPQPDGHPPQKQISTIQPSIVPLAPICTPSFPLLTTLIPQQPSLIDVTSTRNLVILQDFEDLEANAKRAFSVFYNTKKTGKPVKQAAELCPITGLPAKYRDPVSGVGYANIAAYKKLKELRKHGYLWSSMLGAYVGKADHVARGVPEGFLRS